MGVVHEKALAAEERLSDNAWVFAADTHQIKLQRLQFSKAHTGSRNAHGFSLTLCV
jgi:hypothetical protein